MECYEEFKEGWIGGRGGKPYARKDLFNEESLKSQYKQFVKAFKCNSKRGAIVKV